MPPELGYDGELTLALNVRDLERSIAWYRDVLGFTPFYKVESMGWAELSTATPGVSIGLSQVEELGSQGGAIPAFSVRDLDAARAQLELHNVRFEGETVSVAMPGYDVVKLATFYDPDGNTLTLVQGVRQLADG